MTHPALKLFADLLEVPSPSGHEAALAALVRDKATALGYTPETDAAGNLLVRLSPDAGGAPLVLAAHLDEIGLSVTRLEPDGSLRAVPIGGLHPWKHGEGPVTLLGDHAPVTGILSLGAGHSAPAERAVTWNDVRILTGLSPAALAEAGLRPGTPGVPTRAARGPYMVGDQTDPLVAAWTLDDRMGCVALLRLLEAVKAAALRPRQPIIIAFTVQEEVGGHGAKYLCTREQPTVFIAVDGSPIPPHGGLELDGRPAMWVQDRLARYDAGLIADLERAARAAGTEVQLAVHRHTASDASLALSAGGVGRIACFGHVRENSHGFEVARLSVFDAVLKTLLELVRSL